METPSIQALTTASAITGVSSHLLWFIHGEHDFSTFRYLGLMILHHAVGYYALTRLGGEATREAVGVLAVTTASYLCATFASILTYRLLFHKLNKFPGPLSWRLTKFAQLVKNMDFLGFRHIDELHKQYGTIVRVGPSEISIIDPSAVHPLLGPSSLCRKALWYEMVKPLVSLQQCRDKKAHDFRRKFWNEGFNAQSLRQYESRVSKYADKLLQRLSRSTQEPVNVTKWFHYFSFDLMGDLAFGESFGTLETGQDHQAISLMNAGLKYMNVAVAAPWFFYLMGLNPAILSPVLKFNSWSNEQVEKRKKVMYSIIKYRVASMLKLCLDEHRGTGHHLPHHRCSSYEFGSVCKQRMAIWRC